MPTLIYDIMRVMLALTGPAAFVCLVNAGIALRKEGGTVFWIGGGFSRWMLWTVIFLALEPTLVWFQFLGFPVFFPPGAAIGNSWLSGITTGLTTFVNDFVVARLAPVPAAFFVTRAVLDTASGTGPLPSLLSAMFLLAISFDRRIDRRLDAGGQPLLDCASGSNQCGTIWQAGSFRSRRDRQSAGRSFSSPSTAQGICA